MQWNLFDNKLISSLALMWLVKKILKVG